MITKSFERSHPHVRIRSLLVRAHIEVLVLWLRRQHLRPIGLILNWPESRSLRFIATCGTRQQLAFLLQIPLEGSEVKGLPVDGNDDSDGRRVAHNCIVDTRRHAGLLELRIEPIRRVLPAQIELVSESSERSCHVPILLRLAHSYGDIDRSVLSLSEARGDDEQQQPHASFRWIR